MNRRKRERVAVHIVLDAQVYEELMQWVELKLGTTRGAQSIAIEMAVKDFLEKENNIPEVS